MNCWNSTAPTLAPSAAIRPEVKVALTAAALAVLAALAALVPASASAHASVVRTEPVDRAVLSSPVRVFRVVFDDTVTAASGIAAIRNGGGSVLAGRAHVVG